MSGKPIKIVHIISGDLWAGAEVLVYNLIKKQQYNKNLVVRAIILNPGVLAGKIQNLGVDSLILSEMKVSFISILIIAIKYIRSFRPDIIHSHRYKENIISLICKLFILRVKLITTQHGIVEIIEKKKNITKSFVNKLNHIIISWFYANIVAVSQDIKGKLIKEYSLPESKVSVIHNGVTVSTPKQKKTIRDDCFHIGSAGRLTGVKDYSLFIKVASEVFKVDKNAFFYLVGEGPLFDKLSEEILLNNLQDHFFLEGECRNMPEFYSKLDLYINTSIHEGIPMSILEAMSMGLPVVAPKVGGIPEIIEEGMEGYLINSRHPSDFADKCLLIKNENILRQRLSSGALGKIQELFSLRRMESDYFKLYSAIIS